LSALLKNAYAIRSGNCKAEFEERRCSGFRINRLSQCKIGYSPERINPGDEAHSLDRITKIVAGMDDETTETLAKLCGLITNVYKAKWISY